MEPSRAVQRSRRRPHGVLRHLARYGLVALLLGLGSPVPVALAAGTGLAGPTGAGHAVAGATAADAGGPALRVFVNGKAHFGDIESWLATDPAFDTVGTYTYCCPNGQRPFTGWSIEDIIKQAGATTETATQVAIERTAKPWGWVELGPKDFQGSGDFVNGAMALVYPEGVGPSTVYYFFRPQRTQGDDNKPDWVEPAFGQSLTIEIRTHGLLSVTAQAQPTKAKPREPVAFSATVQGGLPNETFTYAWSFTDGTNEPDSADPDAQHAFTASGTYSATVTVTGSKGSGGAASVEVVVGSAAGPQGGGQGNHNKSPTAGPPHGRTSGHTGNPVQSPAPVAPPAVPAAPAQVLSSGATGPPATRHASAPAAPVRRGTVRADGVHVSGYLVGYPSAAPAAVAVAAPAPLQSAGPNGTQLPANLGWIAGAAGIVLPAALIAAGAVSEAPRRRWGLPARRKGPA